MGAFARARIRIARTPGVSGSLWGIGAILVGLVLSVALHELGHLLPAKRFGALVPEFAVGFGPALWKRERGSTVYAIRALPLGGYVRILGMFGPGSPTRKRRRRDGRPTLAEEARIASREEVPLGCEHRAFHRLSWWRKAIVMVCGPLVNLVLALVFLMGAMIGIGSPAPSLTLESVSPSVFSSLGEVPGPAHEAGLRAGDTIEAVDGRAVEDWRRFQELVTASGGGQMEISYRREGQSQSVRLHAVETPQGAHVLGVASALERRRAGLPETLAAYARLAGGTASAVVRLPAAAWDVGAALVTGAERDGAGLMSIVGVGRIAGEVTGDGSALGIDGALQKLAVILSLLASLNMALGIFNLIPLPPLDGGHIAGALVEGARGLYSRLRGLDAPGSVDTARLMPLTWCVAAVLMALTALLVLADIISPLTLR